MRGGGGGGRRSDDASVDSRGSKKRAVKARTTLVPVGACHDKNGCCTSNPTTQIAKMKLMGGVEGQGGAQEEGHPVEDGAQEEEGRHEEEGRNEK